MTISPCDRRGLQKMPWSRLYTIYQDQRGNRFVNKMRKTDVFLFRTLPGSFYWSVDSICDDGDLWITTNASLFNRIDVNYNVQSSPIGGLLTFLKSFTKPHLFFLNSLSLVNSWYLHFSPCSILSLSLSLSPCAGHFFICLFLYLYIDHFSIWLPSSFFLDENKIDSF